MNNSNTRRLTLAMYLLGGVPFGLFYEAMPTLLRIKQYSLATIGQMNGASLPWSVKLLWSPILDRFGRTEQWLRIVLLAFSATALGLGWASEALPSPQIWFFLMLALATCSALFDSVTDGLFVRVFALSPKDEQTSAAGLRVIFFKTTMMFGGGGMIALGSLIGWRIAFFSLALMSFVLAWLIPVATGPLPLPPSAASMSMVDFTRGMRRWVMRDGMFGAIAFTLFFKVGIAAVTPMSRPLWVDRGVDITKLGLVSGLVGLGGLIVGGIVGTRASIRLGLVRCLLLGSLIEASACLTYAFVANFTSGPSGLVTTLLADALTQGFVTAGLTTLITRLCESDQAATQIGVLTATFAFSRAFASTLAGYTAERFGLEFFFWTTPLLCLPALLFLPAVRRCLKGIESRTEEHKPA